MFSHDNGWLHAGPPALTWALNTENIGPFIREKHWTWPLIPTGTMGWHHSWCQDPRAAAFFWLHINYHKYSFRGCVPKAAWITGMYQRVLEKSYFRVCFTSDASFQQHMPQLLPRGEAFPGGTLHHTSRVCFGGPPLAELSRREPAFQGPLGGSFVK